MGERQDKMMMMIIMMMIVMMILISRGEAPWKIFLTTHFKYQGNAVTINGGV